MNKLKVIKILSCVVFAFAFCFVIIGYAAVQDTLLVSGSVSVKAQIKPFAVYGPVYDSNNQFDEYALNFYNRPIVQENDEISLGEGKQVVTAVYTADEWSFNEPEEQPWRFDFEGEESIELITSVAVIDDHIQPTKTRSWFAGFKNCTTFDLAKLDTSMVTEMGSMFESCESVQHLDLSNFETSSLVDDGMETECMVEMFYNCKNLVTLDISLFNTVEILSISNMFSNCGQLTTIYAGSDFKGHEIEGWGRTEPVFEGCTNLMGGNGTRFVSSRKTPEYARIDIPGRAGYFTKKPAV